MNNIAYFILPAFNSIGYLTKSLYSLSAKLKFQSSYMADNILSGFFKFLYFALVFAVVLGIAYFSTKLIAKKGIGNSKNKLLKIVETLPIGFDKSIVLVRAGEQHFLLCSTQKDVKLLSIVDEDKLKNDLSDVYSDYTGNFDDYLNEISDRGEEKVIINPMKLSLDRLKSMVRGNKLDE